jgi:gliding motility-associated-like protein
LGVHQFTTNITGLQAGVYKWSITATGAYRSNSATDPTKVSNDDTRFLFWGPRGVAVDNSFESPFFGRIYAAEGAGGTVSEGSPNPTRTTTRGIYILNSALTDTTQQGSTAHSGNINWAAPAGLYRVSVAPDGKVYMADNSIDHAGVWIMDPANPSATFTPVFTPGTSDLTVHGRIPHCYVDGIEENTKLFTFDAGNNTTGNINRYDIGNATLPWTTAPSAVIYDDAANGNLQQNMNSCIVPDGRGGWWISQYRAGNSTLAIPSLIHLTSTGTLTNFGAHPNIIGSYQGGLAVNADNNLLAMGTTAGSLKVFEINFDGAGIPSLTFKYDIAIGNGGVANGYTIGTAFDVANNIYAIDNQRERLRVFALPKTDNNFTTPASSKSLIVVTTVNKPLVESTVPANGANDVSVNLNSISITFDQEMNTNITGTVEVMNTSTNAVTGSVSSPQWSADNKTVTLNFSGQLDYVTNYTIKISGFNSSSNVQMNENTENSFTTAARPVIINAVPANGANNVSINLNNVSITFNKKMNLLITGVSTIQFGANITGTFASPYWSSDSKTVTLTFTGTLDYSTNYTLHIGGFTDDMGGIMNDTVLNFTTEQKPVQKVMLFVNKDLSPWTDHAKTFTLRQSRQIKFTGTDNFDGSVTFEDVEDGLYRLYDGEHDIKDQVIYGTTGFGLSYFTVLFGLQNSGTATNSVIDAIYDGNAIASGNIVPGGKKLTLQAKGNGASSYTYIWRGTWNGNAGINVDSDILITDALDNIADVHCTITGLSDELILPRVVTPNADGENDFFYVHGLETYPENELRIFNRSGTEVFRAKNYRNNTWNGNNLPDDVYFFNLSLIDTNGAITTKTGYVHLKK